MRNTLQHRNWISRMPLRVASAALALACVLALAVITTQPALAQTLTTLVSFDGTNGESPEYASLVQGFDGNLYGTTEFGGANGEGTVFKITTGGTLTTLYSFCSQGLPYCPDGAQPYGALVLATNGNFYGTAAGGGANGHGTVFKITAGGTLTTLYSFCAEPNCTDGAQPYAPLVLASNGNFYGTTYGGGANGDGTVFEITAGGKLTTLNSFDGTDGAGPFAGLVQATNGNFYGTTQNYGAYGSCGTVFEITAGGKLTTLHSFDDTDGCEPYGGLVQATNGNFYGTTLEGAVEWGTVFQITAGGTLTTLQSFDYTDGANPLAGLVQATDGSLYGTTGTGGANSGYCPYLACGTAFAITPGGTLTTLYSFCAHASCPDGIGPDTGLVQATNGNFYGTTGAGGSDGIGIVFSLSVGLGPFVETLPTSGKLGAKVIILGNNLTGATSVSFNGTAATFTVVSNTEITTTVPSGATTGTVKVVTPGGTLTSNVNFRVP